MFVCLTCASVPCAEMCEAIVKEFSANWRNKLEDMAGQCRNHFPNMEIGVEVLQQVRAFVFVFSFFFYS